VQVVGFVAQVATALNSTDCGSSEKLFVFKAKGDGACSNRLTVTLVMSRIHGPQSSMATRWDAN
jgi:hypothetical protein